MSTSTTPLAERMRPRTLDEIVGQEHLLAPGKPLRRALAAGKPYSMILWGPPGCGKTTLARLCAHAGEAEFQAMSAVLGGVAEVRAAVARARANRELGRRTVLFVDEVHRFNKAQQDAFLPHVEDGTITLIGATTENPSFEVNSALLSRCRVHVLKPVAPGALEVALRRALEDGERGLGQQRLVAEADVLARLAETADGDVRRALTLLDIAADQVDDGGTLTLAGLKNVVTESFRRFDKGGEAFYDQISALHKTLRSSNADAALYWFCRMLDGGCDPNYLARRLTRFACEDIGNADPRALGLALDAWQAYERLGSPEGEVALAQLVLYLAVAAKSNAAYTAYGTARALVESGGSLPVPVELRNAPTKLMKGLGYGAGYQYDHDAEHGIAFGQRGFPEELGEREFYQPVARGMETKIGERLKWIRERRREALEG
ncbi:MAG: replication-associated recombination protein A [Xanthomonadales bacterium]|nr:Replication-associated recombination protein A [Xanthomonadales bacterium]MCC6593431.1 replication-associated recombination protein A [Xanthomonadales bacterium]MCE7931316.1 replication-associated recombination protein A [Xanthomonadales bacterium PRO6]